MKVWALEYQPVGFVVLHKQQALDYFAEEQKKPYVMAGRDAAARLHRYYWELTQRIKEKPHHPGEDDDFIPEEIRKNIIRIFKDDNIIECIKENDNLGNNSPKVSPYTFILFLFSNIVFDFTNSNTFR